MPEAAADAAVALASPNAPPATRKTNSRSAAGRALQGEIEEAGWTTIKGWVWDPTAPGQRIRLELIEEETCLATTVASDYRPSLVLSGVGDGRHEFNIELKDGLLSKACHVLHLRCADSGAAVPGSPIVLGRAEAGTSRGTTAHQLALVKANGAVPNGVDQSAVRPDASDPRSDAIPEPVSKSRGADETLLPGDRPAAEAAVFRCYLDEVSDTEITGWIMRPDHPSHRCVVALKEGDGVLARAIASEFRADLAAAGIGDGCHVFSLAMPRSLLDGGEHLLDVIEEDSGFHLAVEPIRWRSQSAGSTADTILGSMADRAATIPSKDVTLRPDLDRIRNFFDSDYYRRTYPDIDAPGVDPLEHFWFFGSKEGRNPCDWFSLKDYVRHNPDVAESGINPFLHYIEVGRAEGRRIWPARAAGPRELVLNPDALLVNDHPLADLLAYAPRAGKPKRGSFVPDRLRIHWVVPDFSIGSGGHMTIFRMVRWLEIMGHECTIWVTHPLQHKTVESVYDDIVKHFQTVRAEIHFADKGLDNASGDVLVATGWQTAACVASAGEFLERFYFIQDHEPSFYPRGAHSLAAEMSYTYGLSCVCASPWLEEMMRNQYGCWERRFYLAYDSNIYNSTEQRFKNIQYKKSLLPRIAVYARMCTARRAVELALIALQHLAECGEKFRVDLFGDELDVAEANFPCISHGILDSSDLADLYRQCDIGICFSSTNYSLVPQEMMACGLPVVELDVPSTRAIFPKGVTTLCGPHPRDIADRLLALMHNPRARRAQAKVAEKWVAQFSWEQSAKSVEAAFLERLRGRHRMRSAPRVVSVCIPTLNGGPLLSEVVEAVRNQRCSWAVEIIIIDSGSTDGSTARFETENDIVFNRIQKAEFGHGRTRNEAVQLATGEFVAFLTQDALPADEFWLYDLVTVLDRFPNAAGAFGRHLPWSNASPFIQRDINNHFAGFLEHPIAVSRDTDPRRWHAGDEGWKGMLRYYSDNNSCLRRSVWKKIPYPDVDYGEDQAWAEAVIAAGYQKIYVPSAAVYHSHDYRPEETFERAKIEARFFWETFGVAIIDPMADPHKLIQLANDTDLRYAAANGVAAEFVTSRLKENEERIRGHLAGIKGSKNDGMTAMTPQDELAKRGKRCRQSPHRDAARRAQQRNIRT